jgi:hypothetical protein
MYSINRETAVDERTTLLEVAKKRSLKRNNLKSYQILYNLSSQVEKVETGNENPRAIKLLFIVIFITNLMVNMDHGIIPACIEEIRKDI